MVLEPFWKLCRAGAAVLFLILAVPALSQKVATGADVTVYLDAG